MTATKLPWHFWPTFALAIGLAFACLIWSFAWIERPFPGFFVMSDGHVDGQQYLHAADVIPDLRVGDRIAACDDQLMPDGKAVYQYVAAKPAGTDITYQIIRELSSGERQTVTVVLPTRVYRWDEWAAFVPIYWLAGLCHFLLGAYVLTRRPGDQTAQAHWLFCLTLGLLLIGLPECLMGLHCERWMIASAEGLVGVTGMALAHQLPRPWPVVARMPALSRWHARLGLLGVIAAALQLQRTQRLEWEQLAMAYACLGVLAIPAAAVWTQFSHSSSDREARGAKAILWGFALAFLPGIAISLLQYGLSVTVPFQEIAHFALLAAPLSIGYAILRHQLFDITVVIRRTTLYAALALSVAGLYLTISTAGYALASHFLLGDGLGQTVGFLAALTAAVAFHPLHEALRRLVDRMFLGERVVPTAVLASFPKSPLTDPAAVTGELVRLIQGAFHASWVRVTITGGLELAVGNEPGNADSAELQVALTSSHGPEGQILVGPKGTEMPYTAEEQQALNVLADHAAMALLTARLAGQQVQMRVQEASALAVAAERESALLAVDRQLRQELLAIKGAVDDVADGRPDVPFAGVNDSLGRISDYLDGMVPWVKAADAEVETV